MTLTLPLIIYLVFLGAYGLAVSAILWHVNEYTLSGDRSKLVLRTFITIICFLGALSLFLFFKTPFA